MGFTKEGFPPEDLGEGEASAVFYNPKPEHPWLFSVALVTRLDGPPEVAINLQDNASPRKMQELVGLRQLLEKDFGRDNASNEQDDILIPQVKVFQAGPTSRIRSALEQARIPDDIREAVLADLQREWAKAK